MYLNVFSPESVRKQALFFLGNEDFDPFITRYLFKKHFLLNCDFGSNFNMNISSHGSNLKQVTLRRALSQVTRVPVVESTVKFSFLVPKLIKTCNFWLSKRLASYMLWVGGGQWGMESGIHQSC